MEAKSSDANYYSYVKKAFIRASQIESIKDDTSLADGTRCIIKTKAGDTHIVKGFAYDAYEKHEDMTQSNVPYDPLIGYDLF